MTDILERLRMGRSANDCVSEELAHEAADEIERLRKKLAEAEAFIRSDVPCIITKPGEHP